MSGSLRVAIVAGGPSSEAAVSRSSAAGVEKALGLAGHHATVLELGPSLAASLLAGAYDVVFPIAHGPMGEDGCLQGLLEVLGLPYVGCGVAASAVSASKPLAKLAFRAAGLPVAEDVVVLAGEDLSAAVRRIRDRLGSAVAVKPANGGSAIGVTLLQSNSTEAQLLVALKDALALDSEVLVERLVTGREVTCGVLELEPGKPVALPPTLIEPALAGWYDFASKYASGGSRHSCPAPLGEALCSQVQRLAVLAHRAVGARDLSRVDLLVGESDLVVLEVNTLPGMTPTSLYPEAAQISGVPFADLCGSLVRTAMNRPRRAVPHAPAIPGS
jgi:D-alanine-D-alanine ligase